MMPPKHLNPSTLTLGFFFLSVIFSTQSHTRQSSKESSTCELNDVFSNCIDSCRTQLVESIPDGLNLFYLNSISTFDAWVSLLDNAKFTLDIASFYWTLQGSDNYNQSLASKGEQIFKQILETGLQKNIKIRIAQNTPGKNERNYDTELLQKRGAADVRSVNFTRLFGSGVLHSKLWIVDSKHFYLGSANMDWRALTQVKELGILITNCTRLTKDVFKVFEAYWFLGKNDSQTPAQWPKKYATKFNMNNPLTFFSDSGVKFSTYIASSPPPLLSTGRTSDLDAIINTILRAQQFLYISVMDYIPLTLYTKKMIFWPYIDNAIRKAALENRVPVKMLISWWNHSSPTEDNFLHSLGSISKTFSNVDIQIRRFVVPDNENQKKIPFTRVNHNKYMVTDSAAYIGTSNWVGDYFIDTAGIGIILEDCQDPQKSPSGTRIDLVNVFLRDWNSQYAKPFNICKLKAE